MRNIPGLLATTFCIAYLISAKGKRLSEKEGNVVIIGAGPAGLTAAYELAVRTMLHPIVFEEGDVVGGIARTVNNQGNRADLGGHRFFSKSSRVVSWWLSMLPLQKLDDRIAAETRTALHKAIPETAGCEDGPDPATTDAVMLVRTRLSRILYRRKFFDYPLSATLATLCNLGPVTVLRLGISCMRARLVPIKHVKSLEDFFINRFGRRLYETFFKDYSEKVWGIPCSAIQPSWGAQRVKGLSIGKAVFDGLRHAFAGGRGTQGKKVETSLIPFFLYPKLGVGQMWETVAARTEARGGEIHLHHRVVGIDVSGTNVTAVRVEDAAGAVSTLKGDYVLSTMPVRDLIKGMGGDVPTAVRDAAAGLRYRDFLTVVLLVRKLKTPDGRLPDTWIYVQEPDVQVGRIQLFNNWSPALVRDPACMLLGLEYFCQDTDAFWKKNDGDLIALATDELVKLQFAEADAVVEGYVQRMPKAYPGYFGGYEKFPVVREYLDGIENLFLIGRNGMHRYNNMDHSMLTAMTAVDNIVAGRRGKENIWNVNAEERYHEERQVAPDPGSPA